MDESPSSVEAVIATELLSVLGADLCKEGVGLQKWKSAFQGEAGVVGETPGLCMT